MPIESWGPQAALFNFELSQSLLVQADSAFANINFLRNVPLYEYVTIFTRVLLLTGICNGTDFFAIVNKVAMNILGQGILGTYVFISLGQMP